MIIPNTNIWGLVKWQTLPYVFYRCPRNTPCQLKFSLSVNPNFRENRAEFQHYPVTWRCILLCHVRCTGLRYRTYVEYNRLAFW